MLGGFVAGEASFIASKPALARFTDGSQKKRFVFQVSVARRDHALLDNLQAIVGFGGIQRLRGSASRLAADECLLHSGASGPPARNHSLCRSSPPPVSQAIAVRTLA
jgi:hypothetical protein